MATVGQKEISRDYPNPEDRVWEDIQELEAEEADLRPRRMRVGLR